MVNRRRKPQVNRLQVILKYLTRALLAALVGAVSVGLIWGSREAYLRLDTPVRVITVEGKFERISRAELQRVAKPYVTGGIISLDLVQLRDELQRHPWISAARVSRRWPDQVRIYVEEEVPIARWNDRGFLNSRGQLMEVEDNSDLVALPQLSGLPGREREVMTRYREVAELIQPSNLGIAAMSMDGRGVIRVRLREGMELRLGKGNITEKVRRMLVVWNSGLAAERHRIKALDLRYTNGIAVSWRDGESDLANTERAVRGTEQLNRFSGWAERVMRTING